MFIADWGLIRGVFTVCKIYSQGYCFNFHPLQVYIFINALYCVLRLYCFLNRMHFIWKIEIN